VGSTQLHGKETPLASQGRQKARPLASKREKHTQNPLVAVIIIIIIIISNRRNR
jgi:hypothetical protein